MPRKRMSSNVSFIKKNIFFNSSRVSLESPIEVYTDSTVQPIILLLKEKFPNFVLMSFFCYCSPRLFHHPRIYRFIHKIHHEWTAPIGIVAIYAHPLEHAVSNLGPIILGPLIMGSHIATAWMWFCLALMTTINTHSGYHLPLMPSPEAHDFHHLKYVATYLTN